ncbi:MAG: pyridoxamine 5'-phosphate oxidase family protein [Deltaproteobacteria bacterium]|nr:pyridoxamine 5'-phosphate oxidase family protein [Deltaproteobacteria bacterium]
MRYEDVLDFVRENPVCSVATVDGDQPRVRAFLSVLFEDGKIHFTTGATKSVFRQISGNRNVELCYCSRDFSKMLRITGEFEIVDDRGKKQRLIDERDYLKRFSADDPAFVLLRLPHGKARFWTLADNLGEDQVEVLEF